jgi:hypothetical protein
MSQFGWIAAIFEWLTTYILLYPLDKRGMAKADVKAVYNVSVAAIWPSYLQPSLGLLLGFDVLPYFWTDPQVLDPHR